MSQSSIKRYFRALKWSPLPLGVGFGVIAYLQYRRVCKREQTKIGQLRPCDCLASDWEVAAYKYLPLQGLSRSFSWLASINLPKWSRETLLGTYVKKFGCNMKEAEIEDVNQYECLSDLFRRSLKDGARVVDEKSEVVSPADGTVLHFGPVQCGKMEQIKGVSYSLRKFLGPNNWKYAAPYLNMGNTDECFHKDCHEKENTQLYHCIIYLAPGDYHRFHSPADWMVNFRRHFHGELLSVNPAIASWIQNLFVLNERVCFVGRWQHGFFSMSAVGATNVGSIKSYFDEGLKTNVKKRDRPPYPFTEIHFKKNSIAMKKGLPFGEFNMGSSLVIVFEGPTNMQCSVQAGQKVKVGQGLYKIVDQKNR